jgi:hypothetical protein
MNGAEAQSLTAGATEGGIAGMSYGFLVGGCVGVAMLALAATSLPAFIPVSAALAIAGEGSLGAIIGYTVAGIASFLGVGAIGAAVGAPIGAVYGGVNGKIAEGVVQEEINHIKKLEEDSKIAQHLLLTDDVFPSLADSPTASQAHPSTPPIVESPESPAPLPTRLKHVPLPAPPASSAVTRMQHRQATPQSSARGV